MIRRWSSGPDGEARTRESKTAHGLSARAGRGIHSIGGRSSLLGAYHDAWIVTVDRMPIRGIRHDGHLLIRLVHQRHCHPRSACLLGHLRGRRSRSSGNGCARSNPLRDARHKFGQSGKKKKSKKLTILHLHGVGLCDGSHRHVERITPASPGCVGKTAPDRRRICRLLGSGSPGDDDFRFNGAC